MNLIAEKTNRPNKGKSLLAFPDDYVVIDIETTGLSPEYDSIIEVCACKYVNREFSCTYSSLINPEYPISDFITSLTGITNQMLSSAPTLEMVMQDYANFIGDNIIIGHNVNFDINFLYDAYEKYLSISLTNNYVDTLRLVRHLHRDWKHNSLQNVSERYGLNYDKGHRASFDCQLTNSIFKIMHNEFAERYGIETDPATVFTSQHNIKASDIVPASTDFDIDSPLYEKNIVITGSLEKMTRKEAMQLIADCGGINADSVSQKTDYLILGNNDYCAAIKGGKSNKHKKAEQLKLNGQNIDIIPENVFYDMVDLSHFNSSGTSTAAIMSDESPQMTTETFDKSEIDIVQSIEKLLTDAGHDISVLRCHLDSSKVLHISNFYDFICFKLRGKKHYFTFPNSIDVTKYNLEKFICENGRYLINDDFNLDSISNVILDVSSISYNNFKTYEKTTSAKKNLKDYLKKNFKV